MSPADILDAFVRLSLTPEGPTQRARPRKMAPSKRGSCRTVSGTPKAFPMPSRRRLCEFRPPVPATRC